MEGARHVSRSVPWLGPAMLGISLVAGYQPARAVGPADPVDQTAQAQTPGWGGVDPQYLFFWAGAEGAPGILERVGTTGDGKRHQLGFGVHFNTFEVEAEIPARIHEAFAAARKYNLAVAFSFDHQNFWRNRPDLWNWFDPNKPGYNPANKNNVEWSDWKGTPNKARYLNWGTPERLAPHMCFSSPAIRREVTRIVTRVVGPALTSELAQLKADGKEYLFAGILVSSEARIDDYTPAAQEVDPAQLKLMEQDGAPRVALGYCALTARGYSEKNPPADFRKALAEINQEYIAFWAQQFLRVGIPSSRLYTHVAAPFVQETTNGPIWVAFNDYCRPGWTTYPVRFLNADFRALYDQLDQHGNPPWGGVEANAGIPKAMGAPAVAWEEYLGRHFNHGAKLVGINLGASSETLKNILRDSAYSPEAITAYKKFLAGEHLQEVVARPAAGPGGGEPPASLRRKMEQLQAGVQKLKQEGRDPSPVRQIMQQFPPLMQAGKFPEAEAVLDRALERLNKMAPPVYKGPTSY